MTFIIHRNDAKYVLWSDPVVLSLAAMLVWLVAAEVFRILYPAARPWSQSGLPHARVVCFSRNCAGFFYAR